MINLKEVPISREKISLVEKLLGDALNEYNAGIHNFQNRPKEDKIGEPSNVQYDKYYALRYNARYKSISKQSLVYDALLKALENSSFPSMETRERALTSLRLFSEDNSSKLSYLAQMIEIGSKVRQTRFNPDGFGSLFEVVPDDYMRLAELVSDCKDGREKRSGELVSASQKTDSLGVIISDYMESFQSAIIQSVQQSFGQNFDNFSYGTKIPVEVIQEIISKCEQINTNVQNKESDNVM